MREIHLQFPELIDVGNAVGSISSLNRFFLPSGTGSCYSRDRKNCITVCFL